MKIFFIPGLTIGCLSQFLVKNLKDLKEIKIFKIGLRKLNLFIFYCFLKIKKSINLICFYGDFRLLFIPCANQHSHAHGTFNQKNYY